MSKYTEIYILKSYIRPEISTVVVNETILTKLRKKRQVFRYLYDFPFFKGTEVCVRLWDCVHRKRRNVVTLHKTKKGNEKRVLTVENGLYPKELRESSGFRG